MLAYTKTVKPESQDLLEGYRYLSVELGPLGLKVESVRYRNHTRIVHQYNPTIASLDRINELTDCIYPHPKYFVSSWFTTTRATTRIRPRSDK